MNSGHLPRNLASLYAPGPSGLPAGAGIDFSQHAHFGTIPGLTEALRAYSGIQVLPLVNGDLTLAQFEREAAVLAEGLERLQLNPMAKEFVPPSLRGYGRPYHGNRGYSPGPGGPGSGRSNRGRGGGGSGGQGDRSGGARGGAASSGSARGRGRGGNGGTAVNKKKAPLHKALEDNVRRTVYICDIDQQVTEEQLATLFVECGQVVDCRVCGDPNSAMRFAFIEFTCEEAAQNALSKSGTVLGHYPLRVLPSKTAIVPVNNDYLPRTSEEREQCGRTVYAANIDRKVDKSDVRTFFETLCGAVSKIRLLGDSHHSTRIAFVEFAQAESAKAALNCSGALLGSLPIRVSPSKTPVRNDPRDIED